MDNWGNCNFRRGCTVTLNSLMNIDANEWAPYFLSRMRGHFQISAAVALQRMSWFCECEVKIEQSPNVQLLLLISQETQTSTHYRKLGNIVLSGIIHSQTIIFKCDYTRSLYKMQHFHMLTAFNKASFQHKFSMCSMIYYLILLTFLPSFCLSMEYFGKKKKKKTPNSALKSLSVSLEVLNTIAVEMLSSY